MRDLLSDKVRRRARLRDRPEKAAAKPVEAGNVRRYDGKCATPRRPGAAAPDTENLNTTNLTTADRWGNVVEYTLTIEQTGGSGITVPGRGLPAEQRADGLLAPSTKRPTPTASRVASGRARRCRPRSCCATAKPVLALGSPGGSTIITTVLQMLFNRIDRGMTIEQADRRAARRAAQHRRRRRAEQAFIEAYGAS